MPTTHDTSGRPYAKLSELMPGSRVVVDDGFTCMTAWRERTVWFRDGGLELRCKCDGHLLEPQGNGNAGILIGVYHAADFKGGRR